eukprot:CAMPEP_0178428072 /NCGR_PEP_ID=MMETSP0689_2-20121128/30081_1 /TAXON_ID=160604 /ORGANISM="Amphidinium massartii, Strain CS-259" /LENGTH=72 /DNA_ID=CAMNT_0020049817 /DNA_START=169 /DNA_END=387 /DNA_ORIENTATION=+
MSLAALGVLVMELYSFGMRQASKPPLLAGGREATFTARDCSLQMPCTSFEAASFKSGLEDNELTSVCFSATT